MIVVHHLEASRSQRVLWLLEEMGLPYEIVRYPRDPKTRLAPAALKAVHPLGKSPVLVDGDVTVAESGAILEYLVERYGRETSCEYLMPQAGTPEHRECRFWMHYAEGSLMNWLVMKLVFTMIPKQPMPFFAKPIAGKISQGVSHGLVDPNIATAASFIEAHLAAHTWFCGERLSIADFQMSFPVEALLARFDKGAPLPRVQAYRQAMLARPAYQRALERGGPVLM